MPPHPAGVLNLIILEMEGTDEGSGAIPMACVLYSAVIESSKKFAITELGI